MRKRYTAVFSTALGCSLLLAATACAPEENAGGEVTLTVLYQSGDWVFLDTLIEEFEEAHEGVTVKLTKLADADILQTLPAQFQAGNAPDVLIMYPGQTLRTFAEAGNLAALGDLEWSKSANDAALSAAAVDGTPYMVVPGAGPMGAIYNTDTLAEVGLEIPENWDELLDFCADARDAGKLAFGLGLQNGWTSMLVPLSLLANHVDDSAAFSTAIASGDFDYTKSPEWRAALEEHDEMIDAGCFNDSPGGTDIDKAVLPGVIDGSYLGVVTVSAHVGVMQSSADTELNLSIRPLPVNGPDASRLYVQNNNGLAVNAKSENVELAREFVALFGAEPNLNAYGEELAVIPSVASDDFVPPAPLTEAAAIIADGRASSGTWTPDKVESAFWAGVQGLAIGTMTVDEVLESMQTAYLASDLG